MKNPEKTDFNKSFFKGMTLKKFIEYWHKNKFIGDAKNYHKEVCSIKSKKND